MNDDMKRRVFVGTSIGALLGLPFAMRAISGRRKEMPKSDFQTNLERSRRLTAFTTEKTDGPNVFQWKITSPEKECRYISFMESFSAGAGESWDRVPDVFYLSEGSINSFLTKENETIISGKDWHRTEFWPFERINYPQQEFTLWVKNGQLVQIKNKKTVEKKYLERSFVRLLAMNEMFPQVTIGMTTKKDKSRLLPFHGQETHYTACGYEMLDHHKTIRFNFKTTTTDFCDRIASSAPEISRPKTSTVRVENGNAWYDIESGLLVMQQMEIGIYIDNYDESSKTKKLFAKSIVRIS